MVMEWNQVMIESNPLFGLQFETKFEQKNLFPFLFVNRKIGMVIL